MTGSVGLTAGSAMLLSSPTAMKVDQSSKQIISRSSGHRGATSRAVSSIGLPRKELTTNTPAERDCFSTYSSSFAPETRIDGDENHPGQPCAELQHDPFGQIVCPHRYPLARPETGEQGARGALRLGIKL